MGRGPVSDSCSLYSRIYIHTRLYCVIYNALKTLFCVVRSLICLLLFTISIHIIFPYQFIHLFKYTLLVLHTICSEYSLPHLYYLFSPPKFNSLLFHPSSHSPPLVSQTTTMEPPHPYWADHDHSDEHLNLLFTTHRRQATEPSPPHRADNHDHDNSDEHLNLMYATVRQPATALLPPFPLPFLHLTARFRQLQPIAIPEKSKSNREKEIGRCQHDASASASSDA